MKSFKRSLDDVFLYRFFLDSENYNRYIIIKCFRKSIRRSGHTKLASSSKKPPWRNNRRIERPKSERSHHDFGVDSGVFL